MTKRIVKIEVIDEKPISQSCAEAIIREVIHDGLQDWDDTNYGIIKVIPNRRRAK